MSHHLLRPLSVPLDDSWDVIVLGGGPAGCTAAAAAAREGAKTLLIEATGCLGGSGTSSLVPAWCPFSDKEKIIHRGLAEMILNRCKAEQPHVPPGMLDWVPIDPEQLKRIYDDLLAEWSASVLFQTQLVSVETGAGGLVETIVTANKGGLSALRAKIYVDCTGDGDLCARAGAEHWKGDEKKNGEMMPVTHCFVLANVDEYAFRFGPPLSPDIIQRVIDSGRYPLISDGHMIGTLIGPRTYGFNAGHQWQIDNTDPASISRALAQGRKMAKAYRDALAEFHPAAFGNAFLVSTGSTMGVRETRRIIGDYVLTFDDYLARRSFADEICRNSYYIDLHSAYEEAKEQIKSRKSFNESVQTFRYGKGESHGIPYRCLTPKGLRNVLVAGRSISCERLVQGSVRVMPVCLAMGEAAGMAAAHACLQPEPDVHAVDPCRLRKKLRGAGAYLPEPEAAVWPAKVQDN